MKTAFYLLISLCVCPAFAQGEGLRHYTVSGLSMSPALMPGDVVEVDAGEENINRADLVAVKLLNAPVPMIKRVIAIPGDRLEVKGNILWINDRASDPAVAVEPGRWATLLREIERDGWIVPEKAFLLLGDNLENSRDSRRLGLISSDQLKGKVVRVIKSRRVK